MEGSTVADEDLLMRYVAGSVAAFEALYARHELPSWRFVLRLCGNRAIAEELLQEVWFAVAREAPRFHAGARFTPWLYRIARNRVIDHHRTARRNVSLDQPGAEEGGTLGEQLADADAPQPLQLTEQAEQGRALLLALQQLPQEQREAFLLQAEGGLSVQEIAVATEVSFETAKSRLRYARDKLRVHLEDYA